LKKGNEFEVNLHFINAVDFRLVEINIQSILEQKGNLLKNMRSFLIPCWCLLPTGRIQKNHQPFP
jgi:hypothetical protein